MIYLASDHAGFYLKEKIKKHLTDLGHETKDKGNFAYEENDDYPDWICEAAKSVSLDLQNNIASKAIIFGGSGQGEAIAANKYQNIRAVVLYDYNEDIIKLSREHNDANILSLGARFLSEEEAKKAVILWLNTKFSGETRHKRRIAKLQN